MKLKDEIDGDRRKMLTSVGVGRSRPVFLKRTMDDGRRLPTPLVRTGGNLPVVGRWSAVVRFKVMPPRSRDAPTPRI
jgi:hypothetical protein